MFNSIFFSLQELVEESNKRKDLTYALEVKKAINEAYMTGVITSEEEDDLILDLEINVEDSEEMFEERSHEEEEDEGPQWEFEETEELPNNEEKFKAFYEEEAEEDEGSFFANMIDLD